MSPTPRQLLEEMFREMVLKKDASQIERYYHPEFILHTNGQRQNLARFISGHHKVYANDLTYHVRYDEDTWVEGKDSVAVRVWIKTQRPEEQAVEFEVVLIANYLDGMIYRAWELTWPDWSRAKAFDHYV